ANPVDAQPVIDDCLQKARGGQLGTDDRRAFLRNLLLNGHFLAGFTTASAIDYVLASAGRDEWAALFGEAAEKELPRILVELIDGLADLGHAEVLRLVPDGDQKALLAILRQLSTYLQKLEGSARLLRGMRVARLQADLYRQLASDPKVWRRRKMPPCCIDSEELVRLKERKDAAAMALAYESRVNQLQRIDLRRCLAQVQEGGAGDSPRMSPADFDRAFVVTAPLRLGISSANASDNHLRSKERGGKTLNLGIDLSVDGGEPAPPLQVMARRLPEPRLVLRSLSSDFKADFEANARGNPGSQSELFFAYRRGGDESLRMAKQALVHTRIVRPDSTDVMGDVSAFTGGGGLELATSSRVLQGSGLGTSSILAAAILKALYRLTGHSAGRPEGEYPGLYDQSLLLEQSIGLNSGWQDARGACGGASAVKDYYAPPTDGLPAPRLTFVEVDEAIFTRRVILFDTGIARAATRGLNVVLEAYLTRDRLRYPAIRESLALHDEMVAALRAGDYDALGGLATRYWQLRCTLDPGATSEALQVLFEDPELTALTEGGTLTGAGGGGFALLVARDGAEPQLRQQLRKLQERPAFARSAVVDYRLNRTGLQLAEQ
ncbi:MAG: hypothetical protein ABIL09_01865, partial [Gemmatimonadota bacterium]